MKGFSTGGNFFIAAFIGPGIFPFGVTEVLKWGLRSAGVHKKRTPLFSGAPIMNREPLETLDYLIPPEVPIIL
jgi:hypothetical protein